MSELAPAARRRGVHLVLVAAVMVATGAGCAPAQPFDVRAQQRCLSAAEDEPGGLYGDLDVSSVDVREDQYALVTGTQVIASSLTDSPYVSYGWTCEVDGSHVSITFDDTPTPVGDPARAPRLFGADPTQTPDPRNILEDPAAPADQCVIKGNVSFDTGERIYHVPGQEYYDETVINEDYGERWFCTEDDAVAAGWRKSHV